MNKFKILKKLCKEGFFFFYLQEAGPSTLVGYTRHFTLNAFEWLKLYSTPTPKLNGTTPFNTF